MPNKTVSSGRSGLSLPGGDRKVESVSQQLPSEGSGVVPLWGNPKEIIVRLLLKLELNYPIPQLFDNFNQTAGPNSTTVDWRRRGYAIVID